MTTVLVLESADQPLVVREVLGSVTEAGETVHVLRPRTLSRLDQAISDAAPALARDIEYETDRLPEGYGVAELVEFAAECDADRICLAIPERTPTGKARIDDRTQSILLHDRVSGDLTVGEHVLVLEGLEYDG